MSDKLFKERPQNNPMIYAFTVKDKAYKGMMKVGYTEIDVDRRVKAQFPTSTNEKPLYEIIFKASAMREDGTSFTDHDIHRVLKKQKFTKEKEWFDCTLKELQSAYIAVKNRENYSENRIYDFSMRPEQEEAVEITKEYFNERKNKDPQVSHHFLWNCKMRFGKTFTAYKLAKEMNFDKILVLTFKPAVQSAWEEDLMMHKDFEGWQFYSRNSEKSINDYDMDRPLVCFGSFQDYLGKNSVGGIKPKNEWVHVINWDLVIFDEYHYGAWRENAKELFESEGNAERRAAEGEAISYFDEEYMPITTDYYLYLSGTPFRAIASGEFIEDQIYNWTYSDEQKAKEDWKESNNPYSSLPKMVLMTYQLPDSITEIAMTSEFNEFDLNVFFSAEGEKDKAKFIYESEVQKWLNLIRGSYMETSIDNLRLGAKKPPLPYSDVRLLGVLNHTFWFLPNVSSCHAMRNLLIQKQNQFYHDYTINVAAGSEAGIGLDALGPVQKSMKDPLHSKSITLSCMKLTTGVTVKPWTGIFMLRNLTSPETYFQAAFRVQSPWVINGPSGSDFDEQKIIKPICYVFDFAPDRALRQISDYACRLDTGESSPEEKVADFIHFLPVLAYDGSTMKQIDAAGILDIATSGTTATLLARRWESALLVNVDNATLQSLMDSNEAMNALENIEGFRRLSQDIETIINKSTAIKKAKKEANERDLTKDEKKKLTDDEREYKSKRKKIQEKLIKFAARIPIFMYLTDYREQTLQDIIKQLEPGLFKKVTGLTIKDFDLLISLGVFNSSLMNDAVYKFKRYEDSSLTYTGINRHEGEKIGGWDTVITEEELYRKDVNQ